MRRIFLLLFSSLFSGVMMGETLKVYNEGKMSAYVDALKMEEPVPELSTCDSFSVEGDFGNDMMDYLRTMIKDNKNILTIDLSGVTELTGEPFDRIEFSDLCYDMTSLQEFRFPAFSPSLKCYLDKMFSGCASLKKVVNLEYYDKIYKMEATFKNCVSLEEVVFSENENNTPDIFDGRFNEVFYGCTSLRSVVNFDKIHNVNEFGNAFSGCVNLQEIRLCSFTSDCWKYSGAFDNCPAIIYPNPAMTTISKVWQEDYSNKFVMPIEASSSFSTLSNGRTVNIGMSWTPKCALVQDTAWRVGKSFSESVLVNFSDITEKNASDFLWMGVKNETMEDFAWSDSCSLKEEAFAYMTTSYGDLYIAKVDTISRLKIKTNSSNNYPYKIKVGGLLDDSLFNELKAHMKNNSYRIIDFSETDFSMENEWEVYPMATKRVKEFYFPQNQNLRYNLKDAFCNAELVELDMSNLTSITSLENCFSSNYDLVSVSFPATKDTSHVSLKNAFNGCLSLTHLENLENLGVITDMFNAFLGCRELESLSFSAERNDLRIDMYQTFKGCKKLRKIEGLTSFTNMDHMFSTFEDCLALDTLRFGTNLDEVTSYGGPFANCHALIYLPDTVTALKEVQHFSSNFVLPIDETFAEIYSADSISYQYMPLYVVSQDTAWKCTLGGGDTIVKTLSDELLEQSLYVCVGLKNDAMDDYRWSTPIYLKPLEGTYVLAQKQYEDDSLTFVEAFPLDSLSDGCLTSYRTIRVYGSLNDSSLSVIKKALKANGICANDNSKLWSADLSGATFTGISSLDSLFCSFSNLSEIKLPIAEYDDPVSLSLAFAATPSLTQIDLSMFTNITDMFGAFESSAVDRILFSDKENDNEVNFAQAFTGTGLDSLDLSSFTKISDLTQTFFGSTIHSLKFSEKENNLSVSMFQTFAGAGFYATDIVNFDKFTNVNNYIATFQQANNLSFYDDTRLDTVRFGTDPNKIQSDSLTWTFAMAARIGVKYLPEGVDSVPAKWRNYHNFVVPIAVDTTSWSPSSILDNILNLPEISPSYAYVADTTWYVVALDYLKQWMELFGFSTASLRAVGIDEEAYFEFDPLTMNVEDYVDGYALTCVVSNPKNRALAYAVDLSSLEAETTTVADLKDNGSIIIANVDGGVSISSIAPCKVEIFDALGIVRYCGNVEAGDSFIALPAGAYAVMCDDQLLKKIVVR